MNLFTFAFKNIMRNKRRSIVTMLAIAIGFLAVNLFGGYAHRTFASLKKSAIYGEGVGHLTIFKKDYLEKGKLDPKKYAIESAEMAKILELLKKNSMIKMVIPRLDVSGLISNGDHSTIFIAQGIKPEDRAALTKDFPYDGKGKPLNPADKTGAQLGNDLANMLNFKLGDVATAMANTLDGQMNAVDVDVIGIYDTGSDELNDKFLMMPLSLAQSLYNTDSVERMVLLLDDVEHTDLVKQWLEKELPGIGFDSEIKTWQDLSMFYSKVRGMFGMIFMFIFCIVLMIVVTSVINTMTASVVERTREIGTLRALGMRRKDVVKIFGVEGVGIGLLGVLLGIALLLASIAVISASNLTYLPPGVDTPVKIAVDVVPSLIVKSGLFLMVLSYLAAFFPSRKAGKLEIVDALGHI